VANYLYGPTLLRVFGQAAVSDISFYTLNWQRNVPINSTLPTFCAVCQARQVKNAKRSAKRDNNNKLPVASCKLFSCSVAQLPVARMHNARVDSFEIVLALPMPLSLFPSVPLLIRLSKSQRRLLSLQFPRRREVKVLGQNLCHFNKQPNNNMKFRYSFHFVQFRFVSFLFAANGHKFAFNAAENEMV